MDEKGYSPKNSLGFGRNEKEVFVVHHVCFTNQKDRTYVIQEADIKPKFSSNDQHVRMASPHRWLQPTLY
jgi:hypothetical protein